jgi:glycerol uptake facilitator-like aquaporin
MVHAILYLPACQSIPVLWIPHSQAKYSPRDSKSHTVDDVEQFFMSVEVEMESVVGSGDFGVASSASATPIASSVSYGHSMGDHNNFTVASAKSSSHLGITKRESAMNSALGSNSSRDSVAVQFVTRPSTPLLHHDTSAAAKLRRKKIMAVALYGEFFSTVFLMMPQFGVLATAYQNSWPEYMKAFTVALVAGFQVVSITYSFSEMSGAQCNCAISFALWLTGKLSNRKVVAYIITQLFASFVSAVVVYITFTHPTREMFKHLAIFPTPGIDIPRVFATEFFCTFVLAMTAFTIALEDAELQKKNMSVQTVADSEGLTVYATTPNSKSAFAPFAIGFVVFSLSVYGGSNGIAMNPARMFGPAIFSGQWFYFYLYSIAEFCGAGLAAIIVHQVHQFRQSLVAPAQ